MGSMSARTPTSLRLALRELRGHLSTRMGRLTIMALTLVPSIYAGLYLYANHDPYGALDRVPAALVVSDVGAEAPEGGRLEAGDEVADQLLDQGAFDWHRVDATEARTGVAKGDYDFALVIPEHFSASLTSSASADPRQARLKMVTNDANSYLSTTIASTVISRVREAVAERVSKEATANLLLGIADVRKGLRDGASGSGQLHDGLVEAHQGAGRLRQGASRLADGAGTLRTGAGQLADGLATIDQQVAPLPARARRLAAGADRVADGNERIAATGDQVAAAVGQLATDYRARRADLARRLRTLGLDAQQQAQVLAVYDRVGVPVRQAQRKATSVSRDLDRLARGARQVANGNRQLANGVPALVDGVGKARDGAAQLRGGAHRLAGGADRLHSGAATLDGGLGRLVKGAARLHKGLREGLAQIPSYGPDARQRIADTVADPVEVASASQGEAKTYGDGLAPFFMALATWIGAYVLFIVLRPFLPGRERERVHGWRAALGGWLPAAILAAAQASLMVLVAALGVGVDAVDLPSTWLFLLLTAVVFTAIVHAFTAALGLPGQFLALVLMVLQLVTCGGTFPWQTIPTPLHGVHHVLPMTYAVDGLRLIMYGAPSWRLGTDIVVLLAWGVAALAVSLIVGARRGAPGVSPGAEVADTAT